MDNTQSHRDLQIEVRRKRDRLKSFVRTRETTASITKWCLDVALCIACILNYDFHAGAIWLQCKHRRGAPLPIGMETEAVQQLLEEYFLVSDMDRLMSWVDPDTCVLHHTVLKVAQSFAKGYLLANWVRHTNVTHGIVVRTERLIGRFNNSIADDVCTASVLPPIPSHEHPTGRKWAERWRKKHGAVVGKLRVREPITQEEMHGKAGAMEFGSKQQANFSVL
jgi:hypothetical protein